MGEPNVETVRLGQANLPSSRIGIGTWAIGGGWGPQEDTQSLEALHLALSMGCLLIDTAPLYGNGRAERLVAQAISEHGRQPTVLTKIHPLAQEHGPYAGQRKPRRSPFDWSTRYLREQWEAGERNGTVLWEELKTQGYTGSSRSVYRRLATWRKHPQKRGLSTSPESVPRSPFEDVTKGAGHRVDASPSRDAEPGGAAAAGSSLSDG
jgi:hypothetical protein